MTRFEADLCSSRDHAVERLIAAPYALIISDVHLADMDDFLLLKRTASHQPLVPFIVTANVSAKASAREALVRGAFDFISNPLDTAQMRASIHLVLRHSRFRELIAGEERIRERCHQYLTASLADEEKAGVLRRSIEIVRETLATHERTIKQIEQSIKMFTRLAMHIETEARTRAMERLDHLWNPTSHRPLN